MDSIMILVPCPTLQRNETYAFLPPHEAITKYANEQFNESLIDRVRTAVLRRLSILPSLSDVNASILHEVVDTPATYADRYNVAAGTPFGLSHGLQQLSIFRPPSYLEPPPPASSLLSNVFYCGASTRPGNGVPLVLTGAKLVAEKVLDKLRGRRRTRW
jgi:phytoene dehydrogenase-like protein